MLHKGDCLLRLPCRDDLYEQEEIPAAPYFATFEQGLTRQKEARLGNMAFLIAISSSWNDVLQYLYRTRHRVVETQSGAYEHFYGEKQRQLQAFTESLPPHLFPCERPNIERALERGYIGTLISLYALYHATQMKLNRYALCDEMSEASLGRNLRAARHHARELLKFTHTLSDLHRQRASLEQPRIFSVPFYGHSTLSAVDILTSIGSLADLNSDLQLVQNSLGIAQELSRHRVSAQRQPESTVVRFAAMMKALENGYAKDTVFVTTNPMEEPFDQEMDLLFSPPIEARLTALGLGTRTGNGKEVLTIETVGPGI